jgi:hypothetical protein
LCLLDGHRHLRGAQFVSLKLLDSFLESCILEIVCLFLKFEIKQLLFCLEEAVLDLRLLGLTTCKLLLQILNPHLFEELQLLSLFDSIHRLSNESVHLSGESQLVIRSIPKFLFNLFLFSREAADFCLELNFNCLSQFVVLLLLVVELLF